MYIKSIEHSNKNELHRGGIVTSRDGDSPGSAPMFFELEPAIVHYVILSDDDELVPQLRGSDKTNKDYSYVGRIVCRPIHSHKKTPFENLPVAIPIDRSMRDYPLKNEMVVIAKYLGRYYYSKTLNVFNQVNTNFDFVWLNAYGEKRKNTQEDRENINFSAAGSPNSDIEESQDLRVLGEYFEEDLNIHPLRPYEGDLLVEGRFGNSIRFGGYNVGDVQGFDGRNPQILIRNKQATRFNQEDFGTHIEEDINEDGSSIHITSGDTVSTYKTTVETKKESIEDYPSNLDGDQIIINTDRLILSSKRFETFLFGKKTIGAVTDGRYTVDAGKDIVLHSSQNSVINATQTRINSNKIYLGEEENENQPVVLGNQLASWLESLIDALVQETHPTPTGPSGPPVNSSAYRSLRNEIRNILSDRTFTV